MSQQSLEQLRAWLTAQGLERIPGDAASEPLVCKRLAQ